MNARLQRVAGFVLAGLFAVTLTPFASNAAFAFAYADVGDTIENDELPVLGGGTGTLLAKGRVSVFVFFRPNQDHSLDVLKRLADIEQEFAGKPLHFAAVVSDDLPDEAKRVVEEAGIQMPVLIDAGDRVYRKLGVRLHPVIGIVDARSRLTAYLPFEKINLGEKIRAHVRQALGEISEAELAKVLDPPRAAMPGEDNRLAAKRNLNLGRILLAKQNWEKALESAQRAQQRDPTFAGAHTLAGQALAGMGRCAEAAAEFEAALKLDANDAAAAEGQRSCK